VRIAADTGILVRGTARAKGPARELLLKMRAGGHVLILSPFLLEQIKRVLHYSRIQKLYALTDVEIESYIQFLEETAELVDPVIKDPVVLADPTDDPIIYTAVDGRADFLCAMDRDFYAPAVVAFCRQRGIEIMNDVELLKRLR
jgi:putative PIN family toxin of toxin-antitoxin system